MKELDIKGIIFDYGGTLDTRATTGRKCCGRATSTSASVWLMTRK